MRTQASGAEAPRSAAKLTRRVIAGVLAGGLSLSLVGCDVIPRNKSVTSSALKGCKAGWEVPTALTDNPSAAHISMQRGIAELVDDIAKSGAKSNGFGYRVDTIPSNLVGTANAVLTQFPQDEYVGAASSLQSYDNEVCVDEVTGLTYLTPAFLSAVGSLAAANIVVNPNVEQLRPAAPIPGNA